MNDSTGPTEPRQKYWTQVAQKALLGKTIIGIEYANKAALEKLDIDFDGDTILLIKLNDGTIWTVAADDELNGPGALHLLLFPTTMKPVTECLPTVQVDE